MHAAIIKTVCYADIFRYPLKPSEIIKYAIGFNIKKSDLNNLGPKIQKTNPYYHLIGKSHLVKLRRQRTHYSRQKLKIAKKVAQWLKLFPSIKMVAITGALAMKNTDEDDDIDLMIITSNNTLWLTRLLVTPLISLISTRRTPTTSPPNSICINLWLDQSALSMPKSSQNLYIAHEIAQIKVLWDRGDTHKLFLSSNSWINKFLPSTNIPTSSKFHPPNNSNFLNNLAFKLQYLYMKPKLTREKVSLHTAFFHPNKTQTSVLTQYKYRLKKIGISGK